MAKALKEWLPLVLDDVDPWFSDKDILAGERWSAEVGRRLEDTNFGVICLTRENLESPWILFEAGALSKALDEGHVCPYLLDVEVKDMTGPLSQFQAKRADKQAALELLQSINDKASRSLEIARLKQRFERLWPDFESKLQEILEDQEMRPAPARPEPEILEELVGTVRAIDRRLGNLDTRFEWFEMLAAERHQDARAVQSLPPWWGRVVQHLKKQRQALTAAVYGEVIAAWFEENVLWVAYSEEQSFHIGMARDSNHKEELQKAVEAVNGVRPTEVQCVVQ